jgi:hypothetical protein
LAALLTSVLVTELILATISSLVDDAALNALNVGGNLVYRSGGFRHLVSDKQNADNVRAEGTNLCCS